MAAVLACGEGAVLSGRAAAYLYGLIRGEWPKPQVTVAADRRVPGIAIHRARTLDPRDRCRYRRIPITTVPRTVLDLAAQLDLDDLAKACHEAGIRHRLKPAPVKAALKRKPNVAGAWKLREILSGQARVTLSKLEEDFLALLEAEGLPLPQTNRPAGGRYVDCRWLEYRLTVELDSYTYHHSRHAWEQDRRREREARARGDEFRRYTYGDVYEDQRLMLAELRPLLGR
jgi:hypothetical protein